MPIAVLLEGASKNEFIIAVEDFFKSIPTTVLALRVHWVPLVGRLNKMGRHHHSPFHFR
jgi:hypothetical protein